MPSDVIIAMGSGCDAIDETIKYLNAKGEKLGLIKVHLYRPFSIEALPGRHPRDLQEDRCAGPHQGIRLSGRAAVSWTSCSALREAGTRRHQGRRRPLRPGLQGVQPDHGQGRLRQPGQGRAQEPLHRRHRRRRDRHLSASWARRWTSLRPAPSAACSTAWAPTAPSAPTRTPSRSSATTPTSTRRPTSPTTPRSPAASPFSHLRFGDTPIQSTYLIDSADFIACHNPGYVTKYDMVSALKEGGVFLLNCPWTAEELDEQLPASMKQRSGHRRRPSSTPSTPSSWPSEVGMGGRINTIMQAAFFKLADIIPYEQADEYMKAYAKKTYGKKGDEVVKKNWDAIDIAISGLNEVKVPAEWANCTDRRRFPSRLRAPPSTSTRSSLRSWRRPATSCPSPCSSGCARGRRRAHRHHQVREARHRRRRFPSGTSTQVHPVRQLRSWSARTPASVPISSGRGGHEERARVLRDQARHRPQVQGLSSTACRSAPLDCTGCENCAQVCPVNQKDAKVALEMKPLRHPAPLRKPTGSSPRSCPSSRAS